MRTARWYPGLASAALLAMTLVACGDETQRNDDLTDLAIDFGNARGEELAILTDQELGPQPEAISAAMAAQIVLTIDEGEIAAALVALPTLRHPDVIDLAEDMLAQYSAHLARAEVAIEQLGMAPMETAVAAQLRDDFEDALRQLEEAGPMIDIVYLRTQVELQSATRKVAEALDDNVDNGDFDDLLSDTEDMISDLRDDTIDLLRDL